MDPMHFAARKAHTWGKAMTARVEAFAPHVDLPTYASQMANDRLRNRRAGARPGWAAVGPTDEAGVLIRAVQPSPREAEGRRGGMPG